MSTPTEQSNALALDSLLSFAPIGLAFFDPAGGCIRINDYLAHINNLPADEHLGRHISDLYPSAGPVLEKKIQQVFTEGEPSPLFELHITTQNGLGKQNSSICLFPVTGADNAVTEVGAAIFLHQNQVTEEGLHTPHELAFRHLAETLPQVVWTSDPEGNIDYISPQWSDLTGLSADSENYTQINDFIHPDDRASTEEAWQASVANGEIYDHTYRLKNTAGEYRYHTARAVPVRDQDGNISKWYGTTTDVEDQKRIELSYKQATESKDMFIAVLGHELRNPLAAISTHYEVLNHPNVDETQRQKSLKQLGEQIKQLSGLIEDTLDASRLTSGKLRVEKRPCDISQLVENAVDGYSIRAREEDLTLNFQAPTDGLWIDADPVRISQCINNLISNSLKFTDPGGKVQVSVAESADHQSVEITVQDNGIGMKPDEIESLFKPFEQSNDAGHRSKEGLGLGLAVVHKIVELHDGHIQAKSEGAGKGTSVTMAFPAIDKPVRTSGSNDTTSTSTTRTAHILLIDDDESVATSLALFFELEGHEVTVAHCAGSAFKALEQGHPDIIFCDLTLEGDKNGWEFAEQLLAEREPASIPYLVALSGHTQKEYREKSAAAGFDEHLSKPPVPEELRRSIVKARHQADSRRSG